MTIYDPYSECEGAVKALLLEITDYFGEEWQVSSNDVNIARGAEQLVVLRPGSFPVFQQNATGQIKDYEWNIVLEFYVRFTEYEESWERFKSVRNVIFWKLNSNPTLECKVDRTKSATNVWNVTLTSDDNAQYFSFSDTPDEAVPNFIIQTMQVTVRQRVEFTF